MVPPAKMYLPKSAPFSALISYLSIWIILKVYYLAKSNINNSSHNSSKADFPRAEHSFFLSNTSLATNEANWAIRLAITNMSVVAAYMVLADHVTRDLTCLDKTKSLLSSPHNNKFKLCQGHNNHQGAYLYIDMNNGVFIHIGKFSGNHGFGRRHEEHKRGASVVSC